MVSGEKHLPEPDPRILAAFGAISPPPDRDRALDLACGPGRHALWLARRGWHVTGVDIRDDLQETALPGVEFIRANLERGEFKIAAYAWDLIVCWLYWQRDLLEPVARGVRDSGCVALAGKTTGRFATSLAQYRAGFPGWIEINCGENESMAWFIACRP